MTVFTKLGTEINAPVDSTGAPRGAAMSDEMVWKTEVESVVNAFVSNGGLIYDIRANLYADLAHGANTSAWVIADATVAYNGIYRKSGASGAGSWARVADLPYSFVKAINTGSGTPNAIEATTAVPIPAADGAALITLPIAATTTATPVTVSFNGGTALTIKTNSGNNPAIGGIVVGGILTGYVSGTTFRLLSDQASAAIQAAAEAALAEFQSQYLGAYASAPATDPNGDPLQEGAFYWNTASKAHFYWDGTGFQAFPFATVANGAITDQKVAAYADATAIDAGKVAYRPTWTGAVTKPLIARFQGQIHVSEAGVAGDGVTDDRAKLKAIIDYAASVNDTVLLDALNYKINAPIVVEPGSWRSFKLKGAGTGNHQTASSAGTCIVTNGTYNAFEVSFDTFANENFRMEGLGFYNAAQDQLGGGAAIKVIRGANNNRYVDDFIFDGVFANGFAAMFIWQGLHKKTDPNPNSGNVFFGRITGRNVSAQNCGYFWLQQNAGCNLVSFTASKAFQCNFGGFVLLPDGDVGPGNGFGSMIRLRWNDSHDEGVGGMWQTGKGMEPSGGTPIRSTISRHNSTSEGGGASGTPGTGDPWGLTAHDAVSAPNAGTDIFITGDADYKLPFGQGVLPRLPVGSTLASSSPIRVTNDGGRILSSDYVNAPRLRQIVAGSGGTATFTLTVGDTRDFAIETTLIGADGIYGTLRNLHSGRPSTTTTTHTGVGALSGGLSVVWGSGGTSDILTATVTNNGGAAAAVDMIVSNLSGASITTESTAP